MCLALRDDKRFIKRVLCLLLMWAGFSGTAVCQYSGQFTSYFAGKRYDFNITPSLLAGTPAWNGSQSDPPLPARRAIEVGREYLRTLFADADRWSLEAVTLHPVRDRWMYLIVFDTPPEGDQDSVSFPFSVPVAMDGTPIPATVSDWKPDANGTTSPVEQQPH